MEHKILERVIKTHIEELFPGINVWEGEEDSKQRKYAVYSKGQSEIRLKGINGKSFYISRAQPFTAQELKVIHDIIKVGYEYETLPQDTQIYLNSISLSRAVARSIVDGKNISFEMLVSSIIDTLEKWSAQTYEGNRISISFGINPDSGIGIEGTVSFEDFVTEDFSKVLSNGFDTIVELSEEGKLIQYLALDWEKYNSSSSPLRYTAFSKYTEVNNNYAFILNRNGEILIFKSGELVFAKRRGDWRLFTHESVKKQLAFGSRKIPDELKDAIYESVLDVSFARCGGCIGFISQSMYNTLMKDKLIKDMDILGSGASIKSQTMRTFYHDSKFQDIDRRKRQEIIAIDGATIIDSEGKILAAGAILNVSQEDAMEAGGGARLAAAKSLRKYGFSVKISADGEIKAFGKSSDFRFG